MKNLLKIASIALLACAASVAQAKPMAWVDSIDFTPEIYFGSARQGGISTFTYTHNLLDNGFVPGTDLIFDYDLSIGLFDDRDRRGEWAFIDAPGLIADKIVEVNYNDVDMGVSLIGLFSLNLTGMLEITINRIAGDFFLGSSELNARGKTHSVPESSSVVLMLLGLFGIAFARRRAAQ